LEPAFYGSNFTTFEKQSKRVGVGWRKVSLHIHTTNACSIEPKRRFGFQQERAKSNALSMRWSDGRQATGPGCGDGGVAVSKNQEPFKREISLANTDGFSSAVAIEAEPFWDEGPAGVFIGFHITLADGRKLVDEDNGEWGFVSTLLTLAQARQIRDILTLALIDAEHWAAHDNRFDFEFVPDWDIPRPDEDAG
jgi:hypothetical protein